jgi:hypothetical protein
MVNNTKPVKDLKVADYDAIVVAGGQAPMFSFKDASDLHAKSLNSMKPEKLAPRCAMEPRSCDTQSSRTANLSRRERPLPVLPMSRRISPTTPYGP